MTTPQPDPDAPTSRVQDPATGESRPTGYVTQPAGPAPVEEVPRDSTTELWGTAPAPSGDPEVARRRLSAGFLVVGTFVLVVVVAAALLLAGVF